MKQKFICGLVAAVFCQTSFASMVELGTFGYFRTGVTLVDHNVPDHCFGAPGAITKYRLGNECDTYLDISAIAKVDLGDGIKMEAVYGADYYSLEGYRPEYVGNDEKYLRFTGLFDGMAVWAGRRTYRRHDIHTTDFEYMFINGDGFGIEFVPWGYKKVSYAYVERKKPVRVSGFLTQNEPDESALEIHSHHNQKLHHLAIENISLPSLFGGSTLDVELFHSDLENQINGNGVYLHLKTPVGETGQNRVIVQYGQDLLGGLDTLLWGDELSFYDRDVLDEQRIFRLMDEYLVFDDQDAALVLMTKYQRKLNKTVDSSYWFSTGGRYKDYLTDNLNLLYEAGVDVVKNEDNGSIGVLKKITAGIQWSFKGKGLYKGPVVRALITYANWDRDIAEHGDNKDARSGYRASLQYEHWWY